MEHLILEVSEISFKGASDPFSLGMPGLSWRKAEKNLKRGPKDNFEIFP
jgi:hypothetical protein